MGITEKQRLKRMQHIGSSDMAAILGVDPYRTAYDVWLEKTGKLQEQPQENAAMRAGTILEKSVLDYAEIELGKLQRNCYRSLPEAHLGANVDAIVRKTCEPVEAKTSGLTGGKLNEEWGEAETDQVPERVIIQTHVHMLVTQSAVCHVPALLGGRGFVRYQIPFNPELGDVITTEAIAFWERNVLGDTPPEGVPSIASITRRIRTPKAIKPALSPDLLLRWLTAKDAAKDAKEAERLAKEAILAALDDCEAGTFEGLADAVTYYEQERREYFVPAEKYRVLRHTKKGITING